MRISTGKNSGNGTTVPTSCEFCTHTEQSAMNTFWCTLAVFAFGQCQHGKYYLSELFMTMAGDSWYLRHRRDWEETGELIELTRMLRHVSG